MAASPPIKIYRNKEYVASCKYFDDAAAIAGMTPGTVVKWEGKKVIWTEGAEKLSAGEGWDAAAQIMHERVREYQKKNFIDAYGQEAFNRVADRF